MTLLGRTYGTFLKSQLHFSFHWLPIEMFNFAYNCIPNHWSLLTFNFGGSFFDENLPGAGFHSLKLCRRRVVAVQHARVRGPKLPTTARALHRALYASEKAVRNEKDVRISFFFLQSPALRRKVFKGIFNSFLSLSLSSSLFIVVFIPLILEKYQN